MSTPGLRIGETYLFAGYVKKSTNGDIEPEPMSLEPVRNVVLLTSRLAAKKQEDQLWPWMTDDTGKLAEFGASGHLRASPVHYLGNTRRFHLPPPELLLTAWAAYRDQWPKKLAEILVSKVKGNDGLELTEYPIKKSHLKPPDRNSTDETDAAYCTWFDNQPDQVRLFGFILPKTRGLVMAFSKAFLKGSVSVTLPNGTSSPVPLEIQKGDEGLVFALLTGSSLSLPSGLYAFEVTPPQGSENAWNSIVRATGKYQLKEMVRFPVTNFAGDFDWVPCDPISVEEAVMAQFPSLYGHIALMTKARALHPDLEVDFGGREVPKALKEWSERSAWTHSKAALTVGMINAGSDQARAKKIGKVIWKSIDVKNPYLSATKNALDLAFGLQKAYGNWGDATKMLKAEQDLQGVKQLAWAELDSTWQRYRWWKYMKLEYAEGGAKERKILKLAEMPKEDLKLILKAGVPEKFTRLQKLVGKGAARTVTIGLTAAETALGVVDAALAFNEVSEGRKDLEDVKRDFRGLLEQVDSKLGAVACREGMGNLERMRAATVAADLKLDGEEVRALMAALDVILGVLCTVGIGEAAIGVYLFAKGAANALMSAAEFFDREALRGFVKTWFATQMRMSDLASQSRSNQGLMRSSAAAGGNDEHHIQFRLRAEALTGLVKLFVRASVSSRSEEEYRERVKKYRIAEYVQQVLLNEGWQFPLRPLLPIGMDSVWLYNMTGATALPASAAISDRFAFADPLEAAGKGGIDGGMTMLVILDEALSDHVKAAYHRAFPIHRIEADSFDSFADAFRTDWSELSQGAIEYTCIYTRPRGSTDGKDWRLVNAKGAKKTEDLDVLSPLDQIRVLVVLKAHVKGGPYPVSFQLVRVDGSNVTGPVYREVTCPLDSALLASEKDRFKDRIGCVFYPFYQFGTQVIPGIKPLAPGAETAGPAFYRALGYLDDMRYSFEVRLGRAESGPWVSLDGPVTSALNELRVGFRGQPEENKLLIASFLASKVETFEYPVLFGGRRGAGPCFARVGGAPYRLATPEEQANLVFSQFDWQQPVELVLLAWSSQVAYSDYEKVDLDYRRIPIEMQLVNFTGKDTEGPTYGSTLNYVGELHPQAARLTPGMTGKEPSEAVAAWARQVQASPVELRKLAAAIVGAGQLDASYHLWAAHFSLDYYLPDGQYVESLRPFGRVIRNEVRMPQPEGPKYYRVGIRNIRTPKSSGIEQDKIVAPRGGPLGLAQEYEFHFRAPYPGEGKFAKLPPEGLTKWVEELRKKRIPYVQLIKK